MRCVEEIERASLCKDACERSVQTTDQPFAIPKIMGVLVKIEFSAIHCCRWPHYGNQTGEKTETFEESMRKAGVTEEKVAYIGVV